MNKLKKLVFVILMIILILILSIVYLSKEQKIEEISKEFIEEVGEDKGEDINDLYGIVNNVKGEDEYYTVKAIAEKYIYFISSDNKISGMNLIAPVCIKELDINVDNLNIKTEIQLIENSYEYYKLDILKMYYVIEENNLIYFIEGNYKSSENSNNYDIKLMIVLDNNNKTFDIYTEEYMNKHNYSNLNINEKIEFNSNNIENRKTNIYEIKNVTELDMANNYFNDFKNKILTTNSSQIYNEILNQEYAKKRFETLEEFNEYLLDKKSTFMSMKIDKYQLDIGDDYIDYVCTDQYENYYIFRQKEGVMQYSVLLDIHTLENKNFTNKYGNSTDKQKVIMNIQKFISMINSKDYKAAYKLLDNKFIKNNFDTNDKFKDYIKSNFFEYNDITYNSVELESNIYICKAAISDRTANNSIHKNLEVIMKLGSDMEFVMSFNLQ